MEKEKKKRRWLAGWLGQVLCVPFPGEQGFLGFETLEDRQARVDLGAAAIWSGHPLLIPHFNEHTTRLTYRHTRGWQPEEKRFFGDT